MKLKLILMLVCYLHSQISWDVKFHIIEFDWVDMVTFTLSPFQLSSAWLYINTAVLSPPKVSPSNVWLLVYTLSDQKLDAGKAWGQG